MDNDSQECIERITGLEHYASLCASRHCVCHTCPECDGSTLSAPVACIARTEPTVVWRIYIGYDSLSDVTALAGEYFAGVTVYTGKGLWNEVVEPCQVVEYITDGLEPVTDRHNVRTFAERACRVFGQSCVIVTQQFLESSEVVTGR